MGKIEVFEIFWLYLLYYCIIVIVLFSNMIIVLIKLVFNFIIVVDFYVSGLYMLERVLYYRIVKMLVRKGLWEIIIGIVLFIFKRSYKDIF